MAISRKERMEKIDEIFFKRDGRPGTKCNWVGDCGAGGHEAVAQIKAMESYILGEGAEGKVFLGNAFSLQMVAPNANIYSEECLPEDIPEDAVSCIGHLDTAALVSNILGREVACNRASISLNDGDVLYVAQLQGGRLPEGATKLPEGFTLTFRRVVIRC